MVVWPKVCLLWDDQNFGVYFIWTVKVCSIHFVAYLIKSNIHHGIKTWNNTANIRCRSETVEGHFNSEIHKDANEASLRRENSCFEREEEKKVTMLKNEVYFKVFKALDRLARGNCVYQNYLFIRIEKNGCWRFKIFSDEI